jgi:hypothetical protein
LNFRLGGTGYDCFRFDELAPFLTNQQPSSQGITKQTNSNTTMIIINQKRKSFHIDDNDAIDDSIQADELSSRLMVMEKTEFPRPTAVRFKSKKSVHFSGVVEVQESDKTQEEVGLTWLTVS